MASTKVNFLMPIISKTYCSSSQVVLSVRRRPHVAGGGGLVVMDSEQRIVFKIDGCGIVGIKGELILRDGLGEHVLLIRQKGGIVEALSINKQWKSYSNDYQGLQKLIFSIKEPNACFSRQNALRISIEPKTSKLRGRDWDFEVTGYFPDRESIITDTNGNIIAKVGVEEEIKRVMKSKDLYHVVVKPGIDQAFVFGIIAVLDYIHHESTKC